MGGKVLVLWSQIQEQCHVSQTTSAEKKICKVLCIKAMLWTVNHLTLFR